MRKLRSKSSQGTVSIIGAGRLGTALGLALRARGYSIQAVVARRMAQSTKAKRLVEGVEVALTASQLDQLPPSNLILIATPDDAIDKVANNLAQMWSGSSSGCTVLHTSGALSSHVLSPLAKAGFATGSLHPLISVSEPSSGAASLDGAFYCLEGQPAALRVSRRLVKDLGGRAFSIEADQKALYHAAAVMASGHVTALFDLAAELLAKCGPERAIARKVLLPLLESTWKNLLVSAPAEALTGTFARGDEATVAKHLAALKQSGEPGAAEIYRLLGMRSLQLFKRNGGDARVAKQMLKLLDRGR
jgi:predicted short-subunit dehydrogenase-like oxidoreductase (DUF2520 family)